MLINPYVFGGYTVTDANAASYITAVEAADGIGLESGVRQAIDNFVIGCKADGIWNAIKASCILAGARTLSGALVPLVGTAPTNNNFATGDYNRKTGLIGNGSTKYLDTNRASNADPQNSQHVVFYSSTSLTNDSETVGCTSGESSIYFFSSTLYFYSRRTSSPIIVSSVTAPAGFYGISRASSSSFNVRHPQGTSSTGATTSQTPPSSTITVFCGRDSSSVPRLHSSARLAYYSIGENLDLSLLDSRVTTLINAIAAAIP